MNHTEYEYDYEKFKKQYYEEERKNEASQEEAVADGGELGHGWLMGIVYLSFGGILIVWCLTGVLSSPCLCFAYHPSHIIPGLMRRLLVNPPGQIKLESGKNVLYDPPIYEIHNYHKLQYLLFRDKTLNYQNL